MAYMAKYVLQHHKADRAGEHYDLRIQIPRKQLLASWALPKVSIPKEYKEKKLAVRTNDHGKYWLYFSGRIPSGEYGAGTIKIVERGQLEILGWSDKFITFIGNSKNLKGKYHLNKIKAREKKQNIWILMKGKD